MAPRYSRPAIPHPPETPPSVPARDLIYRLQRVDQLARETEDAAKREPGVCNQKAEAVLAELTGAWLIPYWRLESGLDASAAIVLAKAVRVLASMLAAREGETISIAGVLDDLGLKAGSASRSATRDCLRCGDAFYSDGPGNRLCNKCRSRPADPDPHPGDG